MVKVNLKLEGTATMTALDGRPMASFPFGGTYNDIGYDAAVKIEESLLQAMAEHGQRLIQMGYAHAADLASATKK